METADLDLDELREWVLAQRWFASKARDVPQLNVLEVLPLREGLALALVEARFHAGTHELYQLLLREGQWDAVADPVVALLFRDRAEVDGEHGRIAFHWLDTAPPLGEAPRVRPLGAEQSNTSVILEDRHVLKLFRRLEPGDNPELEMLRFLSNRGFGNIPALHGWAELRGDVLDATLGVVQALVPEARDGWELALDELADDPARLLGRLGDLGRVIGEMHSVLGSDWSDPDFTPEEPSVESVSLLAATIDEQIEQTFLDLPDHPDVEPVAGRGQEVRDLLQLMSHLNTGGRLIRHHGDLHLGQTLLSGGEWVVLDFEGEPARSLRERRRKRSPLRDVAGMLRSFAYAATASDLLRGTPAPADWEAQARIAFLDAYYSAVDKTLLPAGMANVRQLLAIFELEKAVYELAYELNNRPGWVRIPVAGIARLLEGGVQ